MLCVCASKLRHRSLAFLTECAESRSQQHYIASGEGLDSDMSARLKISVSYCFEYRHAGLQLTIVSGV